MMKNIYAIGAYQISSADFQLDVLYRDDEIGTAVNYLIAGKIRNEPLLSVLNLDNLNSNGDSGPDGVFDFVEGVTVLASTGRVIFPEREPFGRYLAGKIDDPTVAKSFVFPELYDSTLFCSKKGFGWKLPALGEVLGGHLIASLHQAKLLFLLIIRFTLLLTQSFTEIFVLGAQSITLFCIRIRGIEGAQEALILLIALKGALNLR